MASPIIFSGRRSKLLTADGLLRADGGINDYDGVPNYIKNGHAEVNTTGWATYADAAGSVPVDGTGGAANITWTRSTSSPARGQASFLFTKDAVNRQGQGASYDFTIDRADRAKVLRISGVYEIMSGTYSGGSSSTNSDLIVYIFDVTNGTLIEPAPMKLDGGVIGTQYTFNSTFQSASNSSSYRLIFHCSTTSASAFTINFDSITVGPQVVSIGGSIGDWQAYTPTFTGFGTVSGVSFFSRRLGDSLEVMGTFTAGTTTAVEARISLGLGSATTLTTVSTLPTVQLVGNFQYNQNLAGSHGILAEASKTYLTMSNSSASQAGLTKLNGSDIAVSGWIMSVYAKVQIAGWSSSQILSSETDTRVCGAYYSTATGTINATPSTVTFTVKDSDSHSAYSGGSYTIPIAGLFNISSSVSVTGTWSVNKYLGLSVYVDGVIKGRTYTFAGGAMTQMCSAVNLQSVSLRAGQVVTIRCESDATTPAFEALAANNFFSISRVGGPSQIAATEDVQMKYGQNAATSIPDAVITNLPFDTKDYDSHSGWNGTQFVAPVSGTFTVLLKMQFAAFSATAGTNFNSYLYKNSSTLVEVLDSITAASTTTSNYTLRGLTTVKLKAGETCEIKLRQNSGSARTVDGSNQLNTLSIFRSGNY